MGRAGKRGWGKGGERKRKGRGGEVKGGKSRE